MLFQALDVEIEVKNLNLQVTLLGQKVWEWRSHQAGNQGGRSPLAKFFAPLQKRAGHILEILDVV